MTIHEFIKKRPYLLWYVKDFEHLSPEAIVEATLNYGDWEDVKKIIDILKISTVAKLFTRRIKRKRSNYDPKVANYFRLYFRKHA